MEIKIEYNNDWCRGCDGTGKTKIYGDFPTEYSSIYKCEYCNIETTKTNIIRWHGEKCKNKLDI